MKPAAGKAKAPRARPRDRQAEALSRHERLRRSLIDKIRAWARAWEECPVAGCRRNGRCLHTDACRAVSDRPLTEEELARVRAALAERAARMGRAGSR